MKTTTVAIGDIKPNPNNPRHIKDDKFKKLVASIRDFPQMLELRPIVVDADGMVLGGNMRLRACQAAGLKEVPVIYADQLTEDQKREFIIKDNVGFGEWDWDVLANEWDEVVLDAWGLDVPGFDIDKPTEGLTDPDEVPEVPKEPTTKLGDLWILGDHRLLCGDSTKAEDVEKLMNGEKAAMMVTDPPYNVEYEGNYIQSGRILTKEQKIWAGGIANDNLANFGDWLKSVFVTSDSVIDYGAAIYVWHPTGEDGKYFWSAWLYDSWHFQVDLVWNKTSLIISRWDYKPQHELCMYGWKGKNRSWIGPNNEPTVWDIPRQQHASGETRQHPTQKPVECMARCIRNHDGSVYDPFLGSGTTLIAAEQLDRKCYGMELDPKYCDVIVKRWEDFTGKKAERTA